MLPLDLDDRQPVQSVLLRKSNDSPCQVEGSDVQSCFHWQDPAQEIDRFRGSLVWEAADLLQQLSEVVIQLLDVFWGEDARLQAIRPGEVQATGRVNTILAM